MHLGEKIYRLRTGKKMSQQDLADALEVSRQSISKWETDGSVPELDKLIRLSEIFGISLDELILDKQPEMKNDSAKPVSLRQVTGVILLVFSAVLWLMIALFGEIIPGLILATPFAGCGLLCLLVKKDPGLWCAWVVYLFIETYLRFSTNINLQLIFRPYAYTDRWGHITATAWCLFAIFALLTAVTALRTRKTFPGTLRNDLIGTASGWGVYLLTRIVFLLPAHDPRNATVYSMAYRYVFTVCGFVRSIALAVALVFTLRLVISLWRKRKGYVAKK